MPQSVITANRLTDGVVVWLDAEERWSDRLDAAKLLDDEAVPGSIETLQHRDRNLAVDIRAIPAALVEGVPVPQARREQLRGVCNLAKRCALHAKPGLQLVEHGGARICSCLQRLSVEQTARCATKALQIAGARA